MSSASRENNRPGFCAKRACCHVQVWWNFDIVIVAAITCTALNSYVQAYEQQAIRVGYMVALYSCLYQACIPLLPGSIC